MFNFNQRPQMGQPQPQQPLGMGNMGRMAPIQRQQLNPMQRAQQMVNMLRGGR